VLNQHDVPSGAILTLDQAVRQPQVAHRNTFNTVDVEGIGTIPLFNMTAKFEKTPGMVTAPPPRLGEHTGDVLRGIGYDDAQIAGLKERKVI
jgi:formyl-CoA transferase